jgi:hypothetical protein
MKMRAYPRIVVTHDMIAAAEKLDGDVAVKRTKASEIDTITGTLGEFAFAHWFTGDWHNHEVGSNKGAIDFKGIVEVKASSFPFRDTLNLLVREDYAAKRHPPLYVQVIIDVRDAKARIILPGTEAVIAGFATGEAVSKAPLKDFGSKFGGRGGYNSKYIAIRDLSPMDKFHEAYSSVVSKKK